MLEAAAMLEQQGSNRLGPSIMAEATRHHRRDAPQSQKNRDGLVIDSDYEVAGAVRSIAYELMHRSGVRYALGLEDRVCGVAPHLENITIAAKGAIVKHYVEHKQIASPVTSRDNWKNKQRADMVGLGKT